MVKERITQDLDDNYSTGEIFSDLFNEDEMYSPEEHTIVKGKIVSIQNGNAIIDFNYKSEGKIDLKDFPKRERDELKVGDEIDVYLERLENQRFQPVLSRDRAVKELTWSKLKGLYEKKEYVTGVILAAVKGGFAVDVEGAVAFLPGSQLDVRPVKDATPLIGISQPFQILKMDENRGNIVISRRAILEESLAVEREEALSDIKEGMVLKGVVKNITDYGAFIDLGALDGLLHLTDISWQRITHPSEVLKIGQELDVMVKHFDEKTKRISLSLKKMQDNPWNDAESKYPAKSVHKGVVTNITDYGVFVELEAGIEGLVHVTEMSWVKHNIHPSKIVSVGQSVDVMVLDMTSGEEKLALGIKQCNDNPWEKFVEKYKVGDVVKAPVKAVTDFGMFVGFEDNIDGIIHVSELSWQAKPEKELKKYKKGDEVEAKFIEINPEKPKVSLSIKQACGDKPEDSNIPVLNPGSIVTFIVSKVETAGVEVKYEDVVVSFIKKNDLSKDKVECRPERFNEGDKVDAKVIGFDKNNQKYKVSIKALEIDEERAAIAEYGSADSGAALGNILGAALDTAKKEAEKDSNKKDK